MSDDAHRDAPPGASDPAHRAAERARLLADLEALCRWTRRPCSPEEAAAARWLADRLHAEGCAVTVDEVSAWPSYARALAALPLAAALLPRRPVGLAAALLLADDVSNGRRPWRRLVQRRRPTQNVVGTIGHGPTTLVVLAHHDAAPTGAIFDQTLTRAVLEATGRDGRSVPFWCAALAGPVLVALGARRVGRTLSALTALALADIGRDRIVPGANDNGSAVVAQLALARRLRERPAPGVRVVLASCGAEETLQGGIHPFVAALAGDELVLNLDTIGAARLVLIDGEGELRMEPYTDPSFRDRVARAAADAGVPLERRTLWVSTDSVVPSRAGHPTATLMAVDVQGLLPHYHLPSDTPANVDLDGVQRAVDVAEQVVRSLAAERR